MKIQSISISLLQANKGQIEGLPKNPRKITAKKLENLKRSIEDAPEMLSLRELIVYPYEGKYIVIGGNMRLRACSEIGYTELPCKVLDKSTPVEKLREYAIKDNVEFGENDKEALYEWDLNELESWGAEFPDMGVAVDESDTSDAFSLDDSDAPKSPVMSFSLSQEQILVIKDALEEAKREEAFKDVETFGNNNGNGNALYFIVQSWVVAKR